MSQILIVEDEPDSADVVRRILVKVGMNCRIAETAEIALGTLNADPDFQAVIVDLALPEMDGFELMQTIRRSPHIARLPLIAVTAFHIPELRVKVMDSGFDAYFPKPLDKNLFVQGLQQLIG
jgi:CheY-like chemotaxis protein